MTAGGEILAGVWELTRGPAVIIAAVTVLAVRGHRRELRSAAQHAASSAPPNVAPISDGRDTGATDSAWSASSGPLLWRDVLVVRQVEPGAQPSLICERRTTVIPLAEARLLGWKPPAAP